MARIEKLDDLKQVATIGKQGETTWIFIEQPWTDRKTGEVTTRQRGYVLKQGTMKLAAEVTIERLALPLLQGIKKQLDGKSRKPITIVGLWNNRLMKLVVPAEMRDQLKAIFTESAETARQRMRERANKAAEAVAATDEAADLVTA